MLTYIAIACLVSEALALITLARGGKPSGFTQITTVAWVVTSVLLAVMVLAEVGR